MRVGGDAGRQKDRQSALPKGGHFAGREGRRLGNRRALARSLLRFASSAFALLMGRVFVRGERPRSAAGPLPGILLGFDRGAFAGFVGRVLVGLEGSGGGTWARRCSG